MVAMPGTIFRQPAHGGGYQHFTDHSLLERDEIGLGRGLEASIQETTQTPVLYPDRENMSKYSFEVPDRGDIRVTIRLIYRFAFYD
jgi:hypothetical protein